MICPSCRVHDLPEAVSLGGKVRSRAICDPCAEASRRAVPVVVDIFRKITDRVIGWREQRRRLLVGGVS